MKNLSSYLLIAAVLCGATMNAKPKRIRTPRKTVRVAPQPKPTREISSCPSGTCKRSFTPTKAAKPVTPPTPKAPVRTQNRPTVARTQKATTPHTPTKANPQTNTQRAAALSVARALNNVDPEMRDILGLPDISALTDTDSNDEEEVLQEPGRFAKGAIFVLTHKTTIGTLSAAAIALYLYGGRIAAKIWS